MMIEEKESNNRWRQFLSEEWLSPEEWVKNAIEKSERLRKAKYGERCRRRRRGRKKYKQDLLLF